MQWCVYQHSQDETPRQQQALQSPVRYQGGPLSPRSSITPLEQTTTAEEILSDDNQESRDFTRANWDALLRRPADPLVQPQLPITSKPTFPFSLCSDATPEDLLNLLPPTDCCDFLVIQYFTYLSSMFDVLHGPSFQLRYNAFIQNPTADDPSWLALVFTILAIAVNTLDYNDPVLAGLRSQMPMAENTSAISAELRKASLTCLSRDNFIFNYRFHTLECLLLLIYGISHDQGVDVGWTLLGKPS
jgi:hypothetical protein